MEQRESKEQLIERMTDHAARLRKINKLQLREAIGQALDYFGIQNEEERDEFFREIGKKLGERGRAVVKQGKQRVREAQREEVTQHWRTEAERAGFKDPEDLLKHLND